MTERSLTLGPAALRGPRVPGLALPERALTWQPGGPAAVEAARAVSRVLSAVRTSDALAVGLAAGGVAALVSTLRGHTPAVDGLAALVAALLAVPAWWAALRLARAYEPRHLFAGSAEIHRVGIAGAGVALLVTSLGWLALERDEAPLVLSGVAAGVGLTVAGRWVVRMRVQQANRAGVIRTRVLVVGDRPRSMDLVARLERNRYHGWCVTGDCDISSAGSPELVVATVMGEAERAGASLVLVTPGAAAQVGSITELQRALHGTGRDLALAPPMVEAIGPRVSVDSVCGLPVVRLSAPELSGPRRLLKSVADRGAAATALLLLTPVLLVLAAAVRVTSAGPAVYRQQRVGRDGRLFTIWKFRTMYLDADERQAAVDALNEGSGPLFKVRRDPRITVVGRWLRRTSLDELPQLVNVLTGDMSIVGPRPALPREVAAYDDTTRRRLMVRPGITGLWQIHGRSDLSWEETRRLDVRYVENWSLGFDMSILVRTVDAVLRGRGAY